MSSCRPGEQTLFSGAGDRAHSETPTAILLAWGTMAKAGEGREKGRKSGRGAGGWVVVTRRFRLSESYSLLPCFQVLGCEYLFLSPPSPLSLAAVPGRIYRLGGEVSSGCPRRLRLGQPAVAAGRWESRRRRDWDLAERPGSWSNRPKRGCGRGRWHPPLSPCLCPEAYLRRRVGPRPGRLPRAEEVHRAQKQRPAVPGRCSGCPSHPLPLLTPGGSPRCRTHAAVTFWSLCDARNQQG